jgi:3-(3-hydroxy-phenyl)propionate hydroxylase
MPPFLGQGMCSGFRDAANLAWKLAAVMAGEANPRLLDTYQQEREPHVRSIIERAIELGQMICILDPEIAAERDAQMLAMREAGVAPPMLPLPVLQDGCQPVVNGIRLDDKLGSGPCLITLAPASCALGAVKQFNIAGKGTEPLVPPLLAWLEARGAEAVLIRPDRQVFGIGRADDLLTAWHRHLGVTAVEPALAT